MLTDPLSHEAQQAHAMTGLFDLTGRVVFVAGGGGYLGRPICTALASHGATVIVADVRHDHAEATVDVVTNGGGRGQAMALDMADEGSVNRAVDATAQEHGRLDVLVNCTYFSTGKSLESATADDWQQGLKVTLTGAFVLSRAAGRIMLEQERGSIIQFSSMYGVVSPDRRIYTSSDLVNPPDYGAAKAGLLQLVRYQAVAWGSRGVRVNAITPGTFPSNKVQQQDPEFIQRLKQRVPMQRIGRPEEMVGPVIFLASDASSYVNGHTLAVDGGWTAW